MAESYAHSSSSSSLSAPSPVLKRSASAMLSSGTSSRSRDSRVAKKSFDQCPPGMRPVHQPSLHKFDGAARSCTDWDFVRRKDPELWVAGTGNCFVHLCEKGQSQEDPSFRILFSSLLTSQCQPLIERFVDRAVSEEEAYQNGRVDLYIAAPAGSSRSQAAQYHLAVRNLIAWVSRRSVVGEHLGSALVGLINAMDEFREPEADNRRDLLDYLDEEGYLDMRNHPDHALAILHLAEVLRMSDLYREAFAHCVGMSEHLYRHSEYTRISAASRRLIRRARADMDIQLSRAGAMLGGLLDQELCEARVGLSTSARTHLDRFRAHIHRFYTTKFGSFPPLAADAQSSAIFQADACRTMKADFEALYHYLVDVTFTTSHQTPLEAQGGLCVLQSVHEFDLRHEFPTLDHPLPLLPTLPKTKDSRRRRSMFWFISGARTDQRLEAHAALMQATNSTDVALLDNDLVMAYRQFEEASVMSPQHKSPELGVTCGDARKVRWLFVYAMYQTLRSCADTPSEVRDTSNVGYYLGISTQDMLPWQSQDSIRPSASFHHAHRSTDSLRPSQAGRGPSIGAVPLLSPFVSLSPEGSELKPDIDYFALTHQDVPDMPPGRRPMGLAGRSSLSRSRSQSLTRNLSLRRSLSVFRQSMSTQRCAATNAAGQTHSGMRPAYHEIIVQGYGNGTNSVVHGLPEGREHNPTAAAPQPLVHTPCVTACRSTSTSSTISHSSLNSSSPSTAAQSSVSTAATTTLGDPHSPTSSRQTSHKWKSTSTLVPFDAHWSNKCGDRSPSRTGTPQLPKDVSNTYSNDDMLNAILAPPLPRRSSKRHMHSTAVTPRPATAPNKRWSLVDISASLRECDGASETEDEFRPTPLGLPTTMYTTTTTARVQTKNASDDMFRRSHDRGRAVQNAKGGNMPYVWEQYADLGGLKTVELLSS